LGLFRKHAQLDQRLLPGIAPAGQARKAGKRGGKDIALTQNATFGSNFAANGLSLKSRDEVMLTDREHPGAICAWQERAKKDRIVLKQVLIPTPANDPDQLVELFAGTITSRTRVLAFPHIISSTAVVLPARRLTELAHQHGCLALADGAEALGQIPVDLQDIGCDAYFASPHKWLLAPPGNGMFYIRRDQRRSSGRRCAVSHGTTSRFHGAAKNLRSMALQDVVQSIDVVEPLPGPAMNDLREVAPHFEKGRFYEAYQVLDGPFLLRLLRPTQLYPDAQLEHDVSEDRIPFRDLAVPSPL
jgi:kynureninase